MGATIGAKRIDATIVAPTFGVPLDLLELLARQRARLAQHARVDADLADVVQQPPYHA